jgi:hypothetical protein
MPVPESQSGNSLNVRRNTQVDEMCRGAIEKCAFAVSLQVREHLVWTIAAECEVVGCIFPRGLEPYPEGKTLLVVDALAEGDRVAKKTTQPRFAPFASGVIRNPFDPIV